MSSEATTVPEAPPIPVEMPIERAKTDKVAISPDADVLLSSTRLVKMPVGLLLSVIGMLVAAAVSAGGTWAIARMTAQVDEGRVAKLEKTAETTSQALERHTVQIQAEMIHLQGLATQLTDLKTQLADTKNELLEAIRFETRHRMDKAGGNNPGSELLKK
jgi:hypothetical protein